MRRFFEAIVFARFLSWVCAAALLLAAAPAHAAEDASAPDASAHDASAPDASAHDASVASAAGPPVASAAPAASAPAPEPTPALAPAASTSATMPATSASVARIAAPPGEVKVRDKVVYVFRVGRGDRTPVERAKTAQTALEALVAHTDQLGEVRYEEAQGTAVVFVGKTPVLTIGPEDVEASGEPSVAVVAAQVTTRLSDIVASERKRSAIATTVFSVSLLVFSALIAFWLLGRTSFLAGRLRTWMIDNPERVAAIRLGKIELLSAGAARGGSSIALALAYRFAQFAIAYAWLIFGLSLFEATRGYTEKLTGLIIAPLYAFALRVGSGLPVFIVLTIGVIAVGALVRFVGLFFESVERGDTQITWLARDLAAPTSTLLRAAIVVASLVLASPLITGESDGVLSRVGLVALVAVGLAATPLLASAAIGTTLIYGRRLKKGELVEFGGRSGRVNEVRLLDVRLDDTGGCDVSVPHVLGLFHPTRVHRHPPLVALDIVVDPSAPQAELEKALLAAARSMSARGRVELVYLDAGGAHWRIHSAAQRGETTLGRAVQEALTKLGVGLGRRSGNAPS